MFFGRLRKLIKIIEKNQDAANDYSANLEA